MNPSSDIVMSAMTFPMTHPPVPRTGFAVHDDIAAAASSMAGRRLTGMTVVDGQGRPEPPVAAGETATLLGFLDYQRATLAWKCGGLDAAGLRARVAASPMTLGGMLKHLACVEHGWFVRSLHGRAPQQLRALWEAAVARSRALTAEALADGGLDRLARRTWPDGRVPSLRWILCHMIEEYARHNGHADLIRESVDGLTGE